MELGGGVCGASVGGSRLKSLESDSRESEVS